ncbi:hypothetical protein [Martelella sp. AMO21009]
MFSACACRKRRAAPGLGYLDAGLAVGQIARGDCTRCYGIPNACFAGDILSRFAAPDPCEA